LKKSNETVQSEPMSRGEKAENIKAEFSNGFENNSKNLESETPLNCTYDVENLELNGILDDATVTQAEIAGIERAEKAQAKQLMTVEEAAGFAVKGLQQFCTGIAKMTGKNLEFGEQFVGLFAMATAPVIQKYSRHITLDPEKIDLDSWMPEILALGSITAVGGSTWWQLKNQPEPLPEHKKDKTDSKGGEHGNKS